MGWNVIGAATSTSYPTQGGGGGPPKGRILLGSVLPFCGPPRQHHQTAVNDDPVQYELEADVRSRQGVGRLGRDCTWTLLP